MSSRWRSTVQQEFHLSLKHVLACEAANQRIFYVCLRKLILANSELFYCVHLRRISGIIVPATLVKTVEGFMNLVGNNPVIDNTCNNNE